MLIDWEKCIKSRCSAPAKPAQVVVKAIVGHSNRCQCHVFSVLTHTLSKQIKPMQIKQVVDSLDNNAFAEKRLQSWVWCETPESKCCLFFLKGCRCHLRWGCACFSKNTFHCLYQRNIGAYVLIETQLNHVYRDERVGMKLLGGSVFVSL